MRRSAIVLLAGLLLAAPSAQAGMCALCREALAKGGNPGLIQGFYWSILLIGGVPLLVLSVAGAAIWRCLKQRVESPAKASPPSRIDPLKIA